MNSNRLKIAIDTEPMNRQEKTGHGYYVAGLLEGLKTIKEIEIVPCAPDKTAENMDSWQRLVWDQIGLPKQARRARVDLLHTTAFSVPRFYSGPVVATVHDLALKRFPQNMKGVSGWFLRQFVPGTFKRANHLIADSEATKQDLIKFLKIKPDKITVVHLGVDPFYKPSDERESATVLKKFGLEKNKYFLFVGTLEPRKNIPFLIRSISSLLKQNPEYKLVLAGKKGWLWEEVYSEIAKHGMTCFEANNNLTPLRQGYEGQAIKPFNSAQGKQFNNVILTGYITNEEKRALYSNTTALSYTSSFEGFGMPILEAFACGCPVVSADNSSLPEVVGDAGILLPLEEKIWQETLSRFIDNPKLRSEYSARGLARTKEFTWQKAAEKTAQVYKKVIG